MSVIIMDQEFDYEKYIWQIQFRPWYKIPGEFTYNTTIDYIGRMVTIRKTITNTYMVNDQIYDFEDDECFDELLSYSEIKKLHEFEKLSEKELKNKDRGSRDGWQLKYSYFTHDDPPRVDGVLSTIYDDSPFEKIVEWIRNNLPDADIRI